MSKRATIGLTLSLAAAAIAGWQFYVPGPDDWTPEGLDTVRSLWIGSLSPLPPDPSNAVADDPRAAAFGHRLFFDTRFSANGLVSCSTCHQPELAFTDGRKVGIGQTIGERNTMGLVGVAWSPWMFWDGRKDSLWSQALGPLENPLEHGVDRHFIVSIVADDPDYRRAYEALFGPLVVDEADERTVAFAFANIGKAIAAYERLLKPGPGRFDEYAEALLAGDAERAATILSPDEIAGLQVFIGDGQCLNCHNGPLFTNNEFHNTAVLPATGKLPSLGRVSAVREVRSDRFNCLGEFSDDPAPYCAELKFAKVGDELIGTHRTPSLRNVARTAPYMHAGQVATLAEVVDQYNRAPLAVVGHNEAKPLGLSRAERRQLVAFLRTLDSPVDADPTWLAAP